MMLGVGTQTSHSVSVARIFIFSFAMPKKCDCLKRSPTNQSRHSRESCCWVSVWISRDCFWLWKLSVCSCGCVLLIESHWNRKEKKNENIGREKINGWVVWRLFGSCSKFYVKRSMATIKSIFRPPVSLHAHFHTFSLGGGSIYMSSDAPKAQHKYKTQSSAKWYRFYLFLLTFCRDLSSVFFEWIN